MRPIETFISLLQREPYYKIALSFMIIIFGMIAHRFIMNFAERHIKNPKVLFNWKKTISYSTIFVVTLIVSRVWVQAISSLTTFIGLVSAGFAIALKDMLVNLAGWLFIVWRKPFEVGNRIQIGDFSGDVIDIRPFQFTILEIGNWVKADQSTGRIIHIPNGLVFLQPLCNYDMGFKYIWHEIPVMITFDSDWEKAKLILQDVANIISLSITDEAEAEIHKAAKQFLILYQNLSPKVYTSVTDSGILLTIRYLTEIRQRRDSTEAIWEATLIAFSKENSISLAYPTFRMTQDSASELIKPSNLCLVNHKLSNITS
ncbi:MAG: mechanosensitive ion channel [Candidatus Cloacimonetes bacterium]|nr:mechanosensitive ion channel [Candidatus Cloacimonadota bacterium]